MPQQLIHGLAQVHTDLLIEFLRLGQNVFLDVTPEGLVLREINPEFTVEQVQEATEAKLIIAKDLKPMAQ